MNLRTRFAPVAASAAIVLALGAFGLNAADAPKKEAGKKSAAELEKEKAMQNPYPNDYGPEELADADVPAKHKEGYKLLKARCAQCHSAARPLNSRFVEPDVEKSKKEAEVASLKKSQAELFSDPEVWQVESNIWERYVKRMMAKPGCKISKEEGKKIWEFLVADGKRKIGPNAAKWKAHRKGLVEKLKKEKPERYKELHEAKDL